MNEDACRELIETLKALTAIIEKSNRNSEVVLEQVIALRRQIIQFPFTIFGFAVYSFLFYTQHLSEYTYGIGSLALMYAVYPEVVPKFLDLVRKK